TTGTLATRLGVSPAAVSEMLQRLAARRPAWVRYEKRRGASLTAAGRERALEILRHHRLVETFLHRTLGYSWDRVHEEADKLEHAISEEFEDRIADQLGNPTTDPHGHPIPAKDGSLPRLVLVPLAELPAGGRATVAQVSDDDPEFLRYVGGLGLFPGVSVRVKEVAPFDGPITLRAGRDLHTLGREAARHILVRDVA
ncbi:MAG: DtxR family transcriptional regulator, partial [Gemmatimonadetes bacterium]|nr:DtxR family transcriptional regulator [Gemmatimonadota bacterium]